MQCQHDREECLDYDRTQERLFKIIHSPQCTRTDQSQEYIWTDQRLSNIKMKHKRKHVSSRPTKRIKRRSLKRKVPDTIRIGRSEQATVNKNLGTKQIAFSSTDDSEILHNSFFVLNTASLCTSQCVSVSGTIVQGLEQ